MGKIFFRPKIFSAKILVGRPKFHPKFFCRPKIFGLKTFSAEKVNRPNTFSANLFFSVPNVASTIVDAEFVFEMMSVPFPQFTRKIYAHD